VEHGPTAGWDALRARAAVLAQIRRFFAAREVLEVETPLLSGAGVPDLHLDGVTARVLGRTAYLPTSPEYPMKRLLAAGSGPIYQIARAFRDGESGRLHNPEFTILEWYRPGFDHHALMDEMDDLLVAVLAVPRAVRRTYGELFAELAGVDPHRAQAGEVRQRARELGIDARGLDPDDRDEWLHLILSHVVEPGLGRGQPTFVYDYPASQAALARVRPGDGEDPPVAERFEVYVEGVELANGFHELTDAAEQRRRFEADLSRRREQGRETPPLDERFLAALEAGLPPCAGVALGVDRLVMLRVGAREIGEVVAFPWGRA
jgi:elongation factor P--(R)-beta-lysine ligase